MNKPRLWLGLIEGNKKGLDIVEAFLVNRVIFEWGYSSDLKKSNRKYWLNNSNNHFHP